MITQDTSFANALNCRWRDLRAGPWHTDSIMGFILIHQQTILTPRIMLDIQTLPAGMYFYVVGDTDNRIAEGKIIIN